MELLFSRTGRRRFDLLVVAGKSLFKILPMIFIIVIVVGLLLGFVPPDQISKFFGEQTGILGVLVIGGIGAILHIPSLVAFPLAASLLVMEFFIEQIIEKTDIRDMKDEI